MSLLDGLLSSGPQGLLKALAILALWIALHRISLITYNIYIHPLKHIPGPRLAVASCIPYAYHLYKGDMVHWNRRLHEKYGDVVRVAPNEVSFITGETAFQDIYGFRTGKHKTPPYLKDRNWYSPPVNNTPHLIIADEETHSRFRRCISHGFSDRALREQEPLIQFYVNLLIEKLRGQAQDSPVGGVVNMVRWYNFTTFDIIADLVFGQSLGSLESGEYNFIIDMVFKAIKTIGFNIILRRYPILAILTRRMIPQDLLEKRVRFFNWTKETVEKRINLETSRPDIMASILRFNDEKALSRDEIDSNATLFLVAGSETTATMLSGTTYALLRSPDKYEKLVQEVRSVFKDDSEITIEKVSKLNYLLAVCSEGLRMYPPIPTGFPRVVPKGGDHISGYYLPESTSTYVSHYAAYHSSRNFAEPDSFIPERWLDDGDPIFANDKRAGFQPFSFGPRNCVGKNLAYAEMRLILAKVLFHFDLELVHPEMDWFAANRHYSLWEKPALKVRLRSLQRT